MKILRVIFVIAVLCASFYAQQVNQDIVPASPGLYLGHTNQRWNGYFNNADIYNLTINGSPIGTAGIGLPQISIPNGTNCTILNGLVEFDGNGQAQTASLSSAKVIGVAVSGAGCSGNVLVQYAAIVNCTTDGSTLINDRIAASNSIPGDCMDIGPISIPGIQTVGLVTAVSSGAGQLTSFDLFTGDTISPSSSSGSGVVSVSPCVGPIGYAATAAAIVSWDCNTSLDGSGNAGFKKVTVTGSGAGKIDFGSSTTPGNPAGGFFRLYADSGTGFLTCLNSAGGNCLSSGTAFSAITSGTNTSAAMIVGSGSSLKPLNVGQVADSQAWLSAGISVPVVTAGATSSGSLNATRGEVVEVTYNTAAGETLPSAWVQTATNAAGCASNCSVTVTAPTLASGFTGYSVYACELNTGTYPAAACATPATLVRLAACTNILTNCVITVAPAGATQPPTTNTAWIQPPNIQASNAKLSVIPSVFFPKADGNYYPWIGVEFTSCDNTNGPPTPCGTPVFTHRTFFDDQANAFNVITTGGKNAFVVIDHQSGVGTVLTNQDRALWVNHSNQINDTSGHYSITGIQAEVDVRGAPGAWQAAPDAETAAVSAQLEDDTTNNPTNPNLGNHVIRANYFARPTGQGLSSVAGVRSIMQNARTSGTAVAGTKFVAFDAQWNGASAVNTNVQGIGLEIDFPATASKFGALNVGIEIPNANMTIGGGDWLIDNLFAGLPSNLNGTVATAGLINSGPLSGNPGTYPISGAVSVPSSLTTTQSAAPNQSSGPGCTGGASQYTYQLVGVDNNGGQIAGTALTTGTTCVNPLTSGNPATISIGSATLTPAIASQFIRVDIYRTAGPMATGKIGSVTCISNNRTLGPSCSSFSDTGLAASGALPPTNNTTGTINAAGLQSPIAFTSGALSAGVNSNVTPVTVNANVTTDQNVMAVTLPANGLNVASRNLHVFGAAVYSTPVASVATITIKVKLCTVSGCGSGTVLTPCSYTTSANPGNVTNNSANFVCDITTQTAGASAAFEAHGNLTIDLGATPGLADAVFSDTNTATVGTIDSTAALFLQTTVSFSAASASNSMSERQQITQVTN